VLSILHEDDQGRERPGRRGIETRSSGRNRQPLVRNPPAAGRRAPARPRRSRINPGETARRYHASKPARAPGMSPAAAFAARAVSGRVQARVDQSGDGAEPLAQFGVPPPWPHSSRPSPDATASCTSISLSRLGLLGRSRCHCLQQIVAPIGARPLAARPSSGRRLSRRYSDSCRSISSAAVRNWSRKSAASWNRAGQ